MRRFTWLLAALLLVAAACGGGSDPVAETTVGTAGSVATTAAETTTSATAEDGAETLADFIPEFGFNPDDPEAAQAEYLRQEQEAQELIRECMAAEGFDYIPFAPDEGAFFFGPGGDLSREEFAAQYGFGFTTFYVDDPFEGAHEEFDDPNQEIVEAMDEATREEYYRVLHGDEPDIDFETMTEEEIDAYFQDFVPTGCYAEAQREVSDAEGFYQEFSDDLDEMWEKVQADPRIVTAQAEWSTCMAEAGHEFADQEAMYMYLQERVDEVVTYAEPSPDQIAELEESFGPDGPTEEQIAEMDVLFGPQYDEAELQALNDEEISMALADLDCSEPLMNLYEDVRLDYEAEFVAEHRDALEAYRSDG